MTLEQLEERKLQIAEEIHKDGADLDALNLEIDSIQERMKILQEEKRAALKDVANGKKDRILGRKDEKNMEKTLNEIRNSAEYAKAYLAYALYGKDEEVRSLLSANVSGGSVPVPEILERKIAHAWEMARLFDKVAATTIKGDIKIGFEISATGAVIHTEGAAAPSEEEIVIGVEEFKPQSIKKWITVSDELIDLNDGVMEYLYDEMANKIVKKAQETLIADIVARPVTSSATRMGVKTYQVTGTPTREDLIMAKASLSDEAGEDLVFIANKATIAEMKAAITADGYPVQNPFDGAEPIPDNTVKTYAAASTGNVVGILVDRAAILVNKPNGDELTFKVDDLSLAEQDLVKIVGRQYVALGLKAPYRAVKLVK